MNERTCEIILSRYAQDFLPAGWRPEGQQIGVAGGTLDLLYRDARGRRHVVELKKGPATVSAVQQVLRYTQALTTGKTRYVPWVIAHRVPADVERAAKALGVHTLAIPPERCEEVLARRGIQLGSLLSWPRRTPEALTGGGGDVWEVIANVDAFAQMPSGMDELLRRLASAPEYSLNSGRIQTIIRYRGVKLGASIARTLRTVTSPAA